jgi:urease accessory protein
MIIIEKIITEKTGSPPLERDAALLTWEGRQKPRQRLTTRGGREIGIALSTGCFLSPGDVLYRDATLEIVVEGVPEKVFVLEPETREDFGLVCYQIGNLHRPLGFQEGVILVPYEPVLEKQLERLGFAYTIEERIFTSVVRQSHSHAHVH